MQMPGLLEDVQYGLKGVGNNIVAMTTSLGPWGAAVGIGVVGAYVAVGCRREDDPSAGRAA